MALLSAVWINKVCGQAVKAAINKALKAKQFKSIKMLKSCESKQSNISDEISHPALKS